MLDGDREPVVDQIEAVDRVGQPAGSCHLGQLGADLSEGHRANFQTALPEGFRGAVDDVSVHGEFAVAKIGEELGGVGQIPVDLLRHRVGERNGMGLRLGMVTHEISLGRSSQVVSKFLGSGPRIARQAVWPTWKWATMSPRARMPEWSKGAACKAVIRGFKSRSALFFE